MSVWSLSESILSGIHLPAITAPVYTGRRRVHASEKPAPGLTADQPPAPTSVRPSASRIRASAPVSARRSSLRIGAPPDGATAPVRASNALSDALPSPRTHASTPRHAGHATTPPATPPPAPDPPVCGSASAPAPPAAIHPHPARPSIPAILYPYVPLVNHDVASHGWYGTANPAPLPPTALHRCCCAPAPGTGENSCRSGSVTPSAARR